MSKCCGCSTRCYDGDDAVCLIICNQCASNVSAIAKSQTEKHAAEIAKLTAELKEVKEKNQKLQVEVNALRETLVQAAIRSISSASLPLMPALASTSCLSTDSVVEGKVNS